MASTSACGLLVPLHDDEIPDEFSAAAETRLYFLLLLLFFLPQRRSQVRSGLSR